MFKALLDLLVSMSSAVYGIEIFKNYALHSMSSTEFYLSCDRQEIIARGSVP